MNKTNITCIILTKNEEKNILNCITSIQNIAENIFVVDSGSTDNTVKIAESIGAKVYFNEFINYAQQFNWALDNLPINTLWIYRIDADEIVTENLAKEIIHMTKSNENTNVNGLVMNFRIHFLGKFLKHGGVYPFHNLTIFKAGIGRYEPRAMGEHVILSEGTTKLLKNDCLHYDFKNLDIWIIKHLNYANREVEDVFVKKNRDKLYSRAKITSFFRDSFYYKLPLFLRAKLYFFYRYYIRLGFLDGPEGKIYAFLQSYWYRFIIDTKLYEKKKSLTNPIGGSDD